MFLIYFISYGCNDSALVFLGGAEASASPSFALPMFITIKKIIILHLFLGVPAATVGGTGTPWHTRGYAPGTAWYRNKIYDSKLHLNLYMNQNVKKKKTFKMMHWATNQMNKFVTLDKSIIMTYNKKKNTLYQFG